MRYFLAVAEELHFGRAAQRLNISQPPLSLQIQQLENELGVRLFNRTRKQVSLNRCGEVFLQRVKIILAEVNSAVEEVKSIERGELDSISIGYKSAIMLGEIVPLLKLFQRKYPSVQLKFVQASVADQYRAIHEHRMDVGFIDAPVTAGSFESITENINGYPVVREKMLLAVPDHHRLAKKKNVKLSEFAQDSFIFLKRQLVPSIHDQQLGICQQSGFSPNIRYVAEQLTEVLAFVAAGYGVAFCPESATNVWSDSIRFLRLQEDYHVMISMIFHVNNESKAVQYFCELINSGGAR